MSPTLILGGGASAGLVSAATAEMLPRNKVHAAAKTANLSFVIVTFLKRERPEMVMGAAGEGKPPTVRRFDLPCYLAFKAVAELPQSVLQCLSAALRETEI